MSVFTFQNGENNPITTSDIAAIAQGWGVQEKNEDSLKQMAQLLGVFHESCVEIMDMEDYVPIVNHERYPRVNVHPPEDQANQLNAWAYKVTIKDTKSDCQQNLLAGSNVALKDNISVAGVPMLMGTNFVKGYIPSTDATVVTRLLQAGAIIRGKAVCENLCHAATSHSASTGPVHNPWAKGYSTGGSSSGSGALVADPETDIDISIGADQGGSVRIPSAWCGIVGIKPTFGLIPYTACGSNEATNDHLGVMTSDVLTNAKALQVVAGSDGIDDRGFNSKTASYYDILKSLERPKSVKGLKVAILKEGFENKALDPRVRKVCMDAALKFKELGAVVEEVSIPLHTKGPLIWTGISKVGGYLTKRACAIGRRGLALCDLDELFIDAAHSQERWDQTYPSTRNIYYNGKYALQKFPTLYSKCMNLSRRLKDEYNGVLQDYDIILLPTVPFIANSHVQVEPHMAPFDLMGKQLGLSSNTAGFDQSGHPALALPCGMLEIVEGPLAGSGTKLPVSLQIVGKWFDEETVYKAALAWELSFNWKEL